MSRIPHANRPGEFSNNDPGGDTFGEFLSAPMEEKPMTIRIQLFDRESTLLHTHDLPVDGDDDLDITVGDAIRKLLHHSWSISPGDCIRINEA